MSRGLTLAIEMSNPSCEAGVAIGSGDQCLGTESVNAGDGRHDDLITAIDRLASRLSVGPKDLARVAVSTGPGGYTALRIAIATAKMICETQKAECIAVPTARIVARRVSQSPPFAVILASKDETAFATVFDDSYSPRGAGRLISAAESPSLGVRMLVADRFLPESIRAAAASSGVAVQPPRFDPEALLEISRGEQPIDPVLLQPLYPREPEAVTKWRNRRDR